VFFLFFLCGISIRTIPVSIRLKRRLVAIHALQSRKKIKKKNFNVRRNRNVICFWKHVFPYREYSSQMAMKQGSWPFPSSPRSKLMSNDYK
jgi:hypothetical protein